MFKLLTANYHNMELLTSDGISPPKHTHTHLECVCLRNLKLKSGCARPPISKHVFISVRDIYYFVLCVILIITSHSTAQTNCQLQINR